MVLFVCLLYLSTGFEIYGVRWFLGSHFSYNNQSSSDYYILSFNSEGRFTDDVYVEINNA